MEVVYSRADKADAAYIVDAQIKMALESEGMPLDQATVSAGVSAVFQNSEKGQYYVARIKDKNVGCLLTQYEWSDWRNGTVIWIHSVYVDPEFRGQGIYRGLYEHIKAVVAADQSLRGIRLYVDKSNVRAQKVYSKLGMSNEHYDLYEWMK